MRNVVLQFIKVHIQQISNRQVNIPDLQYQVHMLETKRSNHAHEYIHGELTAALLSPVTKVKYLNYEEH